jgi:hypothetical protein
MNRRTFVLGTAASGAAALIAPRALSALAAGTPAAGSGDYPELRITVTDTAYETPETIVAGRHRVTVTNASANQSHLSLGWIPDAVSDDLVAKWMDADPTNDGSTETLFSLQFVGLPDWPKPGESRTGIVDLPQAGRYFLFNPFGGNSRVLQVGEGAGATADPEASATFMLAEMSIMLPGAKLPAGAARWRVENSGAFTHELQFLPVAAGTTDEELGAYVTWALSIPDGATPDPSSTPPGGGKVDFTVYEPAAAMSLLRPGGTAWIDVDLPAGTYAALCMVPGPTDDIPPHAMLGMHAILEIA